MNLPGLSETSLPKIVQAIRDLAGGGSNAISPTTFALTPGATSTRVETPLCAPDALPAWAPVTESAARAVLWLGAAERGSFVVHHDASAATDRTFRFAMRRP